MKFLEARIAEGYTYMYIPVTHFTGTDTGHGLSTADFNKFDKEYNNKLGVTVFYNGVYFLKSDSI